MLYRSTDRLCRCGAAVENLAHSASFHSLENNAPSNPGIKHLVHSAACNAAGIKPARRRISAVVRPSPLGRQPGGPKRYIQASRHVQAAAMSLASPIHGPKLTTSGLRDETLGETRPKSHGTSLCSAM